MLDLLLIFFLIFVLCPLLMSVSLYVNKKILKVVWDKKLEYQAKRDKCRK